MTSIEAMKWELGEIIKALETAIVFIDDGESKISQELERARMIASVRLQILNKDKNTNV